MDLRVSSSAEYEAPSRYASLQWKRLPPGSGVKLTAEMKASLEAVHKAGAESYLRQMASQQAANPEGFLGPQESNVMYRNNVAMLDRDAALREISIVTDLIESGEVKNYSFRGANGDEGTTSADKYLYWLQRHVATFDVDGTYMRTSGQR